ncbi:MAG: SUMF1/EgtB/PvdO family nonheme iron enzyme [bacterium]|nr:SUMF1/EgtB/PvdO family nonheme iron enzyme [bacterium]
MGAGNSIYVKRTPVTNKEYAEFIKAKEAEAPSNWTNGTYPAGEDNLPVNCVSYENARSYCAWLTETDGVNTYRLPNESEWELAAGHMPKDASFNCGVGDSRTPVEQYAGVTRGAHGAIDFWGNVWEWTSTIRSESNDTITLGVKGGSWTSKRTDCRTEYRKEGRDATAGYEDVGFRVIQVVNGEEPEQSVELATLPAAVVSATATSSSTIELSWQPVEGATEYQLFEYYEKTGLLSMLGQTKETSITIDNLKPNTTYSYIVQPISYRSISDNVSSEYRVSATTREEDVTPAFTPSTFAFSTIKTEVTVGSQLVVKLSSSADVAAVNINGEAAEKIFEGTKKDAVTWKAVLTPTKAGNYTVKAIAYNEDSVASAPITQTVTVLSRGKGTAAASPTMEMYEYNGMSYWLYKPANAEDNMPLVVYLHGYESKSDDPSQLVVTDKFSKWLYEGQFGSVPAYILIPQLSTEQRGWITIKEDVMELINVVAEDCVIDRANISMTGFSIGGSGVWTIGASYCDTFARIAPCAGTVTLTKNVLTNLSTLEIRTFIGSADTVMDPQNTRDCAEALLKIGTSIEVTEFEGATHTEIPELAYLNSDLINWLIGQ